MMKLKNATNPLSRKALENMAQQDIDTITWFSKRSDRTVMWITGGFALGGGMTEVVSGLLNALLKTNGEISLFWGMWIPLCCMTIPLIHYLCRRMQAMQQRIDDLEKLSNHSVGT